MDPTSTRPRFKPSLRIEFVEGEGVYVLSEAESHVLRGPILLSLARRLDGRSTEEELCQQLAGQFSPEEVLYSLAFLRRRGFLSEGDAESPAQEAAFWEELGVDSSRARERLRSARVTLVIVGDVDGSSLNEALAELGLFVGSEGGPYVVLAEDYLHPELAAFNQARLADGQSWLLVRPTGMQPWLGPLFVPDRTGCWQCLANRLEGHRRVEHYLERRLGKGRILPPARGGLPSSRRTVAGMVATALARWVVEGKLPSLEGQVLTFSTPTFETRAHRLTRRPQCSECGDAGLVARRQQSPLLLEPSTRTFTADGGHRRFTPEDTFDQLAQHLSPVTGIVSRMVRTGRPEDDTRLLFTYSTDHNFALLAENLNTLRHSLRSYSGGKGRTDAQAKASALCESIERYSGVWQGDEARIRATLESLGDEALHPEHCLGFSARQYAQRELLNRHHEMFRWIPAPFDPTRPIDWSPAWSLTERRKRHVPTAFCYYGYPFGGAPMFVQADSNGCAAGNTRTEATLQGFLELVERDAVAIWWYNRLRRPGVDFSSFQEPYLLEVAAHWRTRGRELWALDLTSDLGIPTFVAISRQVKGPVDAVVFGFGCHFDARIALLRAVTEHNQFIPLLPVAWEGEQASGSTISQWLREARVERESYLLPASSVAPRSLSDFPAPGRGDLREDVARCVEIARRKGMEMLVLDQTRPDTGLAVVRVIVPGLRHFWVRLGPGRLYDVPVEQGLLKAPLLEEEMNPYPMFV